MLSDKHMVSDKQIYEITETYQLKHTVDTAVDNLPADQGGGIHVHLPVTVVEEEATPVEELWGKVVVCWHLKWEYRLHI